MAACKPRGGEDEAAVQSAPEFALEPDVQRRRLRAYQAIGLPVLLTYTITNAFTGHTVFLLIHSFTLLLMGLSWWMLRCGRCVVKATHTFLASVLFLTTCGPLFEDLFDSQTLWFLPAIPLAAAFILGRRVAYHYLAAATLSLSTVFAIDFFYFPISSDAYVRFDWAILRCVHLAVFSTFAVINHRDTAHRVGELEAKRDLMNKALDEAEAANRSKSVFLANMSHEIRNPMNGILGTTEYLRNSKLDAADQEALDTIARCGEHLSALIDDILDLSRIETGELGIEHDPFNLRELVEHTVALFGPKAQSAGVQLRVDLPASPPRLLGDKKRLSQVL